MERKFENHPCFDEKARGTYGRVHLPVAPKCNVQCRYCNRKFDCVNESRPGVTSTILKPEQAAAYVDKIRADRPEVTVVGIAGPGDPMANPAETLRTMRLVRDNHPEVLLCLSTNGLRLPEHIDEIAEIGVSHVTITVNAIDPKIGAKIYAWVRDGKFVKRGEEAAQLMIERQLESIKRLKEHGITVKINTIMVPDVNEEHIPAVARKMAEYGVDLMNVLPLYPVEGSDFGDMDEPSCTQVEDMRSIAGEYVTQMRHCTRCRADAIGLLGEEDTEAKVLSLREFSKMPIMPDEGRPFVAVGSMEGVLVNQHLGESTHLWVFAQNGDGFEHVDTRETPKSGGGDTRWRELGRILTDCSTLLVSGVGETPKTILDASGVHVIEMEGMIQPTLEAIYNGEEVKATRPIKKRCGSDCAGDGMGCA
jgi:nitrogen fixation protein NifB